MIREMRRKDKALSLEETKALLERGEYGFLATISEDDTPYTMPISFVYNDNAIYIHCAQEGHRLENIQKNNNVCFNVVDSVKLMPAKFNTQYKSAIVFGKIKVVDDLAEKRDGIISIVKKYSPDYQAAGMDYIEKSFDALKILKIDISHMTGKCCL
ncbi:MAG: pyridoxamine 5'-phosphate oxidase family protein [Anaerovoracaceae bacterium]